MGLFVHAPFLVLNTVEPEATGWPTDDGEEAYVSRCTASVCMYRYMYVEK